MISSSLLWIRSFLFYVGFIVSTILWGPCLALIALFFPLHLRFGMVIVPWVSFVLWWLKITCSVHVDIEGQERLRDPSGILLIKHMSTWDALYSQLLVSPQTTVIKRGLLLIPCFGWAFWATKPIPILRNQPVKALKALLTEGQRRLEQNYWVSLFPEGARISPGQVGKFQAGGARLAKESGRSVYLVAHNGGLFWRHKRFIKHPGRISVKISPAMRIGQESIEEFNQELERWMQAEMLLLDPPKPD